MEMGFIYIPFLGTIIWAVIYLRYETTATYHENMDIGNACMGNLVVSGLGFILVGEMYLESVSLWTVGMYIFFLLPNILALDALMDRHKRLKKISAEQS